MFSLEGTLISTCHPQNNSHLHDADKWVLRSCFMVATRHYAELIVPDKLAKKHSVG